jgi:hypothetical protein
MGEIRKLKKSILFHLYFVAVAMLTILILFVEYTKGGVEKDIPFLIESIDKRTYLDSLYWDHLSNCAFINKDNIYINKWGHLRVKQDLLE